MKLRVAGIAASVLALGVWLVAHRGRDGNSNPNQAVAEKPVHPPSGKRQPDVAGFQKAPDRVEDTLVMERLSKDQERKPSDEEWKELTRLLLYSGPGDVVEAVKARFSMQAGPKELGVLLEAYENPINDDTRQNIIDIFSTLQSGDFPETARQILNDASRSNSDNLVCACALSLVRLGRAEDLQLIYQRINAAGEDPESEGAQYSEVDGLMYAISQASDPDLEPFLIDAAEGRGAATTGRARHAAVAALGNYESETVIEVLDGISKNEANPRVRKQAERSLEEARRPK